IIRVCHPKVNRCSNDSCQQLERIGSAVFPAMRLPRMRLSVRRMLALVAVLTVPFAFWGWRLRTGVRFPAGLDVATIAVTVVSASVIADILIRASRDRPRLLGPVGWGLLALDMA